MKVSFWKVDYVFGVDGSGVFTIGIGIPPLFFEKLHNNLYQCEKARFHVFHARIFHFHHFQFSSFSEKKYCTYGIKV